MEPNSDFNIDFTPSYRTITATGKSHFSSKFGASVLCNSHIRIFTITRLFHFLGVSDALAEFIDNSLQAVHDPAKSNETIGKATSSSDAAAAPGSSTAKRLIEIKIFFDEGSIVIADK